MHPRKKTGLQGQEEKAVCVEGREKSGEKGQEEKGKLECGVQARAASQTCCLADCFNICISVGCFQMRMPLP